MITRLSKIKSKSYSFLILLLLSLDAITAPWHAPRHKANLFHETLTASNDTTPVRDTVPASVRDRKDSLAMPGQDSGTLRQKVDTFQVRMSKDSMNAPVNYKAQDSMVLDVETSQILLYGKSEVNYTDVKLSAPRIIFDQNSSVVTARMAKDTVGNVIGMAKLVQAKTETVSDSILFNFKTQKGLTHSSFFQQQEIYNFAEKVKKVDPETFYAYKGRFTTCNLDTPHFAFRFKKAKFINNKVAVTGPVHPEFEGVPLPIYLPFGIFPLKTGRHSGLIPPQLTFTENLGLGLEGLGYYKAFNEYYDAKIWADIYSYGSWRFNVAPSYRLRYRYTGNFTFSMQSTKNAFKGDPDYSLSKSWFITWNHSMDGKARPGVNFSAFVRAGSSKYLQNVTNGHLVNSGSSGMNFNNGSSTYLQPVNFTNQLSSSITYQKSWAGRPFNLSVGMNHNQNTQTKIVNINLPDVAFIMNTVYPFKPRESVGAGKWYERLGVGYTGNFKGQVSFYDTAFRMQQLIDTFQWGAAHDIPIQLSLPPVGPLQFGPSISYRERWYAQKFVRSWNAARNKVDTTVNKGFFTAREMSVGMSMSTAFFGKYQARNKEANLQALRIVMRPQIGFTYKPDLMEQYYYRTQIDSVGNRQLFSVFDGAIFGPLSSGKSGSISFGLDNNLEGKIRNKDDSVTDGGTKKMKIIDGFGFSSGYNFLADSFQLAPFSLYARSYLFDKINITANAILDPYQVNPYNGYRINKYAWQGQKFSLGQITTGSLNVSTQFKSKKKDDKKKSVEELAKGSGPDSDLSPDQVQAQLDYVRRNPSEFADFNIPWSVNISWSLSFARILQPNYTFKTQFSSSFNFNGDFNISPKWKVGATGFYDLRTLKMQSLTTFISRDLHCWQMSINIQPVGLYRYFSISINPKSGLLRDLRINRTRYFSSQ